MPKFTLVSLVLCLGLWGCGGAAGAANSSGAAGVPRPGPAPDLGLLTPQNAVVVLHTDLRAVRNSTRYEWFVTELIRELGLSGHADVAHGLLDRTDEAIGVFLPGGPPHEGFLVFDGRFAESDFDRVLEYAQEQHPGQTVESTNAAGARFITLGNATVIRFDQWTFGVANGADARAYLQGISFGQSNGFRHRLTEFGPRIGLPPGSAQAWASQDTQAGAALVSLVFAGENPQMVHNFVNIVSEQMGF